MYEHDQSDLWRVDDDPRGWPIHYHPYFEIWIAADEEELEDTEREVRQRAQHSLEQLELDGVYERWNPRKATDEEVGEIMEMADKGYPVGRIAKITGLAWGAIKRISEGGKP